MPAADVVVLGGIRVTSLERTLVDLVPRLERPDALAVLDSALASGLMTNDDLARCGERAACRRGCGAVADLWGLADARAESPLESRVRMRCIDGGLPPDDLQFRVRDDDGHLLARADMLFTRRSDPRARPLLLEADGTEVHGTPEAVYRDRSRTNILVTLRWEVVRCTWVDTLSATAIPAMVRRAL